MRRIESDRRQQRSHLLREIPRDPVRLGLRELGAAEQPDASGLEFRQHLLIERAVLLDDQLTGLVADPRQHLARLGQGHADRRDLRAQLLAQAGHADLEELVQIAADDAQEAQPLQRRHLRIRRQRQHPPIERQQRKFAIERGCVGQGRRGRQRIPGAAVGTTTGSDGVGRVFPGRLHVHESPG